jgi:hypothetical protein
MSLIHSLIHLLPYSLVDPVLLAAAVKAQVEYYFSKENLKNDSFLLSKMDAQGTVAVDIILEVSALAHSLTHHLVVSPNCITNIPTTVI